MKKKLLIIFIIGILILLTSTSFAKENVNIKITTEDHPFSYNGYMVIKLTNSNGKEIKNGGTINYTITDSDGNYEWKYQPYHGKISKKLPNGKYTVDVKFKSDSKYNNAHITKSITIDSDGSQTAYTYYDNHNYGDSILYDNYIEDNYWDDEIYDDPSTYDGEGY